MPNRFVERMELQLKIAELERRIVALEDAPRRRTIRRTVVADASDSTLSRAWARVESAVDDLFAKAFGGKA